MAGSLKGLYDDAGKSPASDMDADEDEDQPGDEKLPPDFEAAYDEYEKDPSAMTFWRAVEACAEHKSGGGLAILIGGKGKKK